MRTDLNIITRKKLPSHIIYVDNKKPFSPNELHCKCGKQLEGGVPVTDFAWGEEKCQVKLRAFLEEHKKCK